MALKEMSSRASVDTDSWPVSSCGKKPLGIAKYSQTVAATVAKNTSSMSGLKRRQNFRIES